VQQPHWRQHPAFERTRQVLTSADPLVSAGELRGLHDALAAVARGEAHVLQLGDCAESFYECTADDTNDKLGVLDRLAERLDSLTDRTVVRVGRIGGQFAKPRSQPTERHGDKEIPAFRGHLVNSEVPTPAARQHDPRRMLWAYEASGKVLEWTRAHRELREQADAVYPSEGPALRTGPWCSHEALVMDYEGSLVRVDPDTGASYLSSTHLPWIGMRTLQPDSAHVHLLASVVNPVGCKIGPSADPETVLRLCETLDPERVPGRLMLIVRMGHDTIRDALPPLVAAVRDAGHPVVWMSDPMHGNTVKTSSGVKTRHLEHIIGEAVAFREILEAHGEHAGGLHLEVASADVTECVGGLVRTEDELALRYTSLCDPRLNLDQGIELLEAWV
jgi:3-deoxy-7-phosphoheptulonate synthase